MSYREVELFFIVFVCLALKSPPGVNVMIWGKARNEAQRFCHYLLLVPIPSDYGERGTRAEY